MIDTTTPFGDGWWLARLSAQLKVQRVHCQELQSRYEGDSPLPFVSDIQRSAVRWFVEKSRSNFERLIVNAVLSRLRIAGMRTAVDSDDGGDEDAFTVWRKARGKLFSLDAHKMALAMSMSFVVVGKDGDGNLLVTAEDPRNVTVITDPANPYKVLAGLKLYHDDVADQDVAHLYLPGRVAVATRDRKTTITSPGVMFTPAAYAWDEAMSGVIDEVADLTDVANPTGLVCVVPFVNEDGMAEFEPYLNVIDRINQQILQRMTIATIQAFKQRAFKGLPTEDPVTGVKIDYDAVFVADPGAIWNIPATVDIWESGQVDLQPILLAIRDDIKDLAATSGTPLYSITPDAAQGSAEGASLQREQVIFKVETRQDRWEPSHELVCELIFRMTGDTARSAPNTVQIIWAPAQKISMAERANAIAQTKGTVSRYQALTEIWGMDPAQAARNMSELTSDLILDQQYAIGLAAATANTPAAPNPAPGLPVDNAISATG